MDDKDREILEYIQHGFPLKRDPWAVIGSHVDLSSDEVIARIRSLRDSKCIREISGIFDCVSLGYSQSLVAFMVPDDSLEQAAAIVSMHPGVGHCYGREAKYNLWFTLAVSSDSCLGHAATVERLSEQTASSALVLPSLRRYKLSTVFRGAGHVLPVKEQGIGSNKSSVSIGQDHRSAVRALQVDLQTVPDPFAGVAASHGIGSVDELLDRARFFETGGYLRRYAAVVHHRSIGAVANAMVVWKISDARMDYAGIAASEDVSVSHCYSRPTFPDWPFGLYTMVHGSSRQDALESIGRIADRIGVSDPEDRQVLWTTREFTKRRVRLFTTSEKEWEQAHS